MAMKPYELRPIKWKYRGASKEARKNSIESVKKEFKSATTLQGLFFESVVLVDANANQSSLLERGCFGKLMHGNLPASSIFHDYYESKMKDPKSTNPNCTDSDRTDLNCTDEFKQMYQFTLVEAFYLCYAIKCLDLYIYENERRIQVDAESAWQIFHHHDAPFASHYAVYHHLRDKNWIVRPGIQFGVDYMAYRHHPSYVHSDFSVFVIDDDKNPIKSWVDVHANTRLCTSVAKTLLLAYVILSQEDSNIKLNSNSNLNLNNLSSFHRLHVKTVQVKRWIAEKNREER